MYYDIVEYQMCLIAHTHCASGSVGGARPCQGRGRGFESRLALIFLQKDRQNNLPIFFAYRNSFGYIRNSNLIILYKY